MTTQTSTAYSVYYYSGTGAGHGMAGLITDDGGNTSSTVLTYPDLQIGLNGNPIVQAFADGGGNLRVAVTDNTDTGARPISIYDAQGNSVTTVPGGWSNVYNLYGIAKLGSYIYAIDYDNGRVVEINPSTYAQTGAVFTAPTYTSGSTTYYPHAQALLVIGGVLYGLFTYANSSFTSYANSKLVKFSITPGSSITAAATNFSVAPNAFSLANNGSTLYVAAIGGYQSAGSYNSASRLQSLPSDLSSVTDVLSPSSTFPWEIRDISFNGSTAYLLVGAYNSSYNLVGKLFSAPVGSLGTPSTFTVIDDFTAGTQPGYYWAAQYTSDNNRIWYARGNEIILYAASSSPSVVTTLTVSGGSLINNGESYTNISDFSYIGADGFSVAVRGYRSPIHASNTPRMARARALTSGRPLLTDDELAQLNQEFAEK